MKYAASVRYAGLLIDATECDYNSFRNLGLTCFNCHESVFLVAESSRQGHMRELKDGKISQVKPTSVSAHFSHRPDKDKTELDSCELRCSGISKIDIQKSALAAKNQRIRLFNRHLWKILKQCYKLNDVDEAIAFVQKGFNMASCGYPTSLAQYKYQSLIEMLRSVFRNEVSRIHAESEMFFNKLLEKTQNKEYVQSEALEALLALWRDSIDKKMQVQIYNEVVDCIMQKRHLPILDSLIVQGVYNFLLCIIIKKENSLSYQESRVLFNRLHGDKVEFKVETFHEVFKVLWLMNQQQTEALASFVRDDILEIIALTPWADGFQRLEDKECL